MINLEAKTKLNPGEVVIRLKKFFGKEGLGLEMTEDAPLCLTFQGGGGYVTATLCLEEGITRINLLSQEWDRQVKEFITGVS